MGYLQFFFSKIALTVWGHWWFHSNYRSVCTLGCRLSSFSTLSMSCHSLLVDKVCAKKSADSVMGFPLYVMVFFSLAALKNVLAVYFAIVITMCHGVDLLGLICFEGSLCRPDVDLCSSLRVGRFQLFFLQINFLLPFLFLFSWDPCSTMVITMPDGVTELQNLFSFSVFVPHRLSLLSIALPLGHHASSSL